MNYLYVCKLCLTRFYTDKWEGCSIPHVCEDDDTHTVVGIAECTGVEIKKEREYDAEDNT